MKVFDYILQGNEATLTNAIEVARSLAWSEVDTKDEIQSLHENDYQATEQGIEIWYNWKADYYWFAPAIE